MRPLVDLSGKRFGRLQVLQRSPRGHRKHTQSVWLCQCDCGAATVTARSNLIARQNNSCGCTLRTRAAAPEQAHP